MDTSRATQADAGIRRARLVSFSGIDGAGKSTQIEALRLSAEAAGLRVAVIPFWDQVAQLKRLREVSGHKLFKGDQGVGTPAAPIVRRDKNVRSRPMTCIRLGLYLLDGLALRRVMARVRRGPADLIICDRYLHDELANLTLSKVAIRGYVRMLLRLAPKADIHFLLEADPAQAFARKPEYPLDFLYTSRESYLKLAEMTGSMTIVPARDAATVSKKVLEHAFALFACDHRGARFSSSPIRH